LKFPITIGISNVYSDIYKLPLAYKEALFAVKNKLVLGNNKVILFTDTSETVFMPKLFTMEQRKQMLMAMRMGESNEVCSIINELFKEVRNTRTSGEILYVMCIEFISTCIEFMSEYGASINSILGNDFNIFSEVQTKNSVDEMENWINDIVMKVVNFTFAISNKKSTKIVDEAKKYIKENLSITDLKIDDIAKKVYVKYGYLCFLFKRDTGVTINNYITDERINSAKELFDKGYTSVELVSNMVGYADSNYFGRCFKKVYGITPTKYIELINLKNNFTSVYKFP